MWSQFYFRKKLFRYPYILIINLPYFIRYFIKILIHFKNLEKRARYFSRISGQYNFYLIRKYWFRPKIGN